MAQTITLRAAVPADLSAVDRLLARSYPRLLAADYPPSTLVTAVPLIARARPELLASGRYYLAVDGEGRVVGAGGWSRDDPQGEKAPEGVPMAQVRHVATDPALVRQGVGRRLMQHVLAEVRAEGFDWMDCLSTRTAMPFYSALGFRMAYPLDVALRPGIVFPVVRMLRDLRRD